MGGQDKGLLTWRGRTLIEWAIEGLTPQADALMISANRNLERYRALGVPVIADRDADFPGPLAGILAALRVCPDDWLLIAPCDGPRVPADLAARLAAALEADPAGELAAATDGIRPQPLHALLPTRLAPSLAAYLASGARRVDRWYARHRVRWVDFSDCPEAFANLNTPEDLARLGGQTAWGQPVARGSA